MADQNDFMACIASFEDVRTDCLDVCVEVWEVLGRADGGKIDEVDVVPGLFK